MARTPQQRSDRGPLDADHYASGVPVSDEVAKAGRGEERAQGHALEGFVAATVLIGTLLVVIQIGSPGALGAQGGDAFGQDQGGAHVETLLTSGVANGTVETTLVFWNNTSDTFHNTTGAYETGGPPTVFGQRLNESLGADGVAFDLTVYHGRNGTDRRLQTRIVDQGEPGDNAVVATRTVTLFDDDTLVDDRSQSTNVTLVNATGFYASDAAGSDVYNVVEVEVVAWRT